MLAEYQKLFLSWELNSELHPNSQINAAFLTAWVRFVSVRLLSTSHSVPYLVIFVVNEIFHPKLSP